VKRLQRVGAGIDANLTNKEIRALDKVGYLINTKAVSTGFESEGFPND
jgi:hypothetical protein